MSYRGTISPSWCANIKSIPLPLAYYPVIAPTYIVSSERNDDWSHFVGDARRLPQQFISLLLMVCMLLEKETVKYKRLWNYILVISALYAIMNTTIWTVSSPSFFVIQVICRHERDIMSQLTPVCKALQKLNSKLKSFWPNYNHRHRSSTPGYLGFQRLSHKFQCDYHGLEFVLPLGFRT